MRDLNPQLSRCKRDTLPIELITLQYKYGVKGFEPSNNRIKNEGLTKLGYTPNSFKSERV